MAFIPVYSQIRNLLNENIIFDVPRYQRNYVWGETDLKNLFEDINLVVTKRLEEPEKQINHFIGSFIFEDKKKKWEIVDGQQRLSSLTILISCVSKKLRQLEDINSSDALSKYFFYVDDDNKQETRISNGSDVYKLIVGKYYNSSDEIKNIQELINSENIKQTKKDSAYLKAALFFEEAINKIISNKGELGQAKTYLLNLRDAILDLETVRILSTTKDEGYIIFQVLNSRGKPLETHELVKNYIFTYSRITQGVDIANSIWEEIISNTEQDGVANSSIDRFLTNYIVHRFGKISKKNEFNIIETNIKKTDVKPFLDDLKKKSKIYKRITRGEGYSEEINYVLKFLNRYRNTQFRPILLSILSNANKENIKNIEKTMNSIKNFLSIYLVICKEKTNRLEKIIYKYAKEINESYSLSLVKEFLDALYDELPNKDTFTERFKRLSYSKNPEWYPNINVNNKKEITHVLTELEIYHTTDDKKVPKQFTLEHVKDDSEKGNACYIGNIIPLSSKDNKAANGKDIKGKLEIYSRSSYAVAKNMKDRIIKHFNSNGEYWNDVHIKGNTERLANLFFNNIWKRII